MPTDYTAEDIAFTLDAGEEAIRRSRNVRSHTSLPDVRICRVECRDTKNDIRQLKTFCVAQKRFWDGRERACNDLIKKLEDEDDTLKEYYWELKNGLDTLPSHEKEGSQ